MTKTTLNHIRADLQALATPAKAKVSSGFFKTGKGEYGEGDVFIGITVPQLRNVAKNYVALSFDDLERLLSSQVHEHRYVALLILVLRFPKASVEERKAIVDFYLEHRAHVNNWDLVDTSASYILGEHLLDKDTRMLDKMARSRDMWERRIAIVATQAFIKNGRFDETRRIATLLLDDEQDLIHKATGWMLREVGKKDEHVLKEFLDEHVSVMPRTMLRYAIDRFDKKTRADYLFR